MKLFFLLSGMVFCLIPLSAKEPSYSLCEHTISAAAGSQDLKDTYLSPLSYNGWTSSIIYNGEKLSLGHSVPLLQQWETLLRSGNANSPSGSPNIWSFFLEGGYKISAQWEPILHLKLSLGGFTRIKVGGLYNLRNGNNPANASVLWDMGLNGRIMYQIPIRKFPLRISYQAEFPLLGIGFAPDFGASYYEMFMLYPDPLSFISFVSVHNSWRFNQQIGIDIPVGKCFLKVGYRGSFFSSDIKSLQTRQWFNDFTFGVVIPIHKSSKK